MYYVSSARIQVRFRIRTIRVAYLLLVLRTVLIIDTILVMRV